MIVLVKCPRCKRWVRVCTVGHDPRERFVAHNDTGPFDGQECPNSRDVVPELATRNGQWTGRGNGLV